MWVAPLFIGLLGGEPEKIEQAKQKTSNVTKFLESLLNNRPYFGSQNITLAEAVAGAVIPQLPSLGISLGNYSKMRA